MIQVPLGQHEMKVMYNVNNGPFTEFWVPAANQNMRWAAYSVSPANLLKPLPRKLMSISFLRLPASLPAHSATGSLPESTPMISVGPVSSLVTIPFGRT